jgi:23S rRNA pseudouridine2604 synthase
MRINKYVASGTGMSRRAADTAIADGRVSVNGQRPESGYIVAPTDTVTLDGRTITPAVKTLTIMLNKPARLRVFAGRAGEQNRIRSTTRHPTPFEASRAPRQILVRIIADDQRWATCA